MAAANDNYLLDEDQLTPEICGAMLNALRDRVLSGPLKESYDLVQEQFDRQSTYGLSYGFALRNYCISTTEQERQDCIQYYCDEVCRSAGFREQFTHILALEKCMEDFHTAFIEDRTHSGKLSSLTHLAKTREALINKLEECKVGSDWSERVTNAVLGVWKKQMQGLQEGNEWNHPGRG